jgi:hypothetical protein
MTTRSELNAESELEIVSNMAGDRPVEFNAAGIDELAAMPVEQRIAKLRSMADGVFNAAVIGSFLAARDLNAVADLLIENPSGFGNARLELAKAAEEARCFLTVIDAAERRLTAGLAAIANGSVSPDLDAAAKNLTSERSSPRFGDGEAMTAFIPSSTPPQTPGAQGGPVAAR